MTQAITSLFMYNETSLLSINDIIASSSSAHGGVLPAHDNIRQPRLGFENFRRCPQLAAAHVMLGVDSVAHLSRAISFTMFLSEVQSGIGMYILCNFSIR